MQNKPSSDHTDRFVALLGLAAKKASASGSCLSDERLAALIDGALKSDERRRALAHLNDCNRCHSVWLEMAADLGENKTLDSKVALHRPVSIVQEFLTAIRRSWFPIPIAAGVVLLIGLVLVWPVARDINGQVDTIYASFRARDTSTYEKIAHEFPLPWEKTALGFSDSQPPTANRAFGAGVIAALNTITSSEKPVPNDLTHPSGRSWRETEWSEYFGFGRWSIFVWTLAKAADRNEDWTRHQDIHGHLLANLKRDVREHLEAKRAVAALERIQPYLAAVNRDADSASYEALSREILLTIQELAPNSL